VRELQRLQGGSGGRVPATSGGIGTLTDGSRASYTPMGFVRPTRRRRSNCASQPRAPLILA
jgi:hypothetical protein